MLGASALHTSHRGLRPQTPHAFWFFNIGVWLAFLNQVRKNLIKSPIHYECWVQHRPYLKNMKNWYFIRFRTLRSFLDQKLKTALFEGGSALCMLDCLSLQVVNLNTALNWTFNMILRVISNNEEVLYSIQTFTPCIVSCDCNIFHANRLLFS